MTWPGARPSLATAGADAFGVPGTMGETMG